MVRAFLLAALLLSLAACERDGGREPFAESRTPASLAPRFYPPEGWAWGYIGVGDQPLQRYGVASTRRVPVATVVIVPGYGETAELWFETASDLIERGCTVWILDRAGQGGSGRYVLPRDLGFTPSFDPEVAALRELVRVVVRPTPETPLILLTQADGAVVALSAVRSGLRTDGVIASSPQIAEPPEKALLGPVKRASKPPPGWKPWSRERADDLAAGRTHDAWRGQVGHAWMTANPDLRLAGPSLGWTNAFETASRVLESGARQVRAPVLMLNPDRRAGAFCRQLADCTATTLSGARSALHIESDRWRGPWLDAVGAFIDARQPTVTAATISAVPARP
ncbi:MULTISPECIES: serine aminopeptidase domain-containing protein [unclassified Phenylobacterium]|uniref:serine aminopeptidase domain-containing protein n=1 Tax=unclassified Phenylobacterium TaxID=2640670 RepID=UPI0022B2F809|nr:alpha/beta hydrolase [Phenylobacterium sp. NIBR 498073]MBS0488646.1 alpha/beta hydrolase [Pseudomonadota bacterium]WGU38557.1 alpha/beta hydrolase [Phenylobacterium sp. NIBR 498073]